MGAVEATSPALEAAWTVFGVPTLIEARALIEALPVIETARAVVKTRRIALETRLSRREAMPALLVTAAGGSGAARVEAGPAVAAMPLERLAALVSPTNLRDQVEA